jgi:hypothetical protein
MTCTLYGTCCAERDLAAYYRHGRLTGAHSIDELIPDLDGPIAVTVDHDDDVAVGVMVHGEIDQAGQLHAVCAVEDWVADIDEPIYYSAELLAIGPGVRTRSRFIVETAALTGLSITTTPAAVAARALTVLPGDVRDAGQRSRWPMSWRTRHPLLVRAVDHGATTRLLDRRRPVLQRLADGGCVSGGAPLPERGAGLWRSGGGRVVSVG